MSVYGYNEYIGRQLQSIYDQEGVDCHLLVRDDGSSDAALAAFLDGEAQAGRLTWYSGSNLRPARSFWDLLSAAPDADFYAFADHDDVWLPDKLATAVRMLGDGDAPALYFGQTQLVDADLHPLPNVIINPRLTLGEALVYQFVGGNTMVFNHALRQQLLRFQPSYFRMHDIWVYDVALALDTKVIFDPQPHILYRQHGGNAVGQAASWRFRWKARWQRITGERHIRSRLAALLLEGYADIMPPANAALVRTAAEARSSWRARHRLITDPAFTPADASVARSYKLAAMLGLF